jgi:hypothetical protein
MLRVPTARLFDSEAPVYGPRGEVEDVGRAVTVRAAGPVYDSYQAGREPLPALPADLVSLFV